jgi:hypothetical protein
MMKQLIAAFSLMLAMATTAQTFAPAFNGFSKKKPTYITLKDGTELTVNLKSLKYKKGLIDDLKIIDENGEKVKINPEEISHMYVPPSNIAKFNQMVDAATDVTKIADNELSSEHLKDGYLYMESSNVQIKKKKTQYCMLQLMNPAFSKMVKVYNDPYAAESASVGVGGMTVAGGLDKSYYIKIEGEDVAKRIKKKEYKKDMEEIFTKCPDVVSKYGADPSWSEFEQFIYEYTIKCQ